MVSYSTKKTCAILSVLFITGCVSTPVPKMENPQASAIGIQIETRAPITGFRNKPDLVYFLKADRQGDVRQGQLIPSNFARDGRIYLLNAMPGTYAAIAAIGANQAGVSRTDFSTDLVEAARVDVRPGEFAFMGSFIVDQSLQYGQYNQFRGTIKELKRDHEARTEFLRKARDELGEGGWGPLLSDHRP
jgi:hypothetical protein